MNPLRKTAVGLISTVALGAFAVSVVPAQADDDTTAAPCAAQQAQTDRANAKLAALTAKFAAHPSKKVKKAKKAQVQRVARATARLDACVAAGGVVDPDDSGETDETPESTDVD